MELLHQRIEVMRQALRAPEAAREISIAELWDIDQLVLDEPTSTLEIPELSNILATHVPDLSGLAVIANWAKVLRLRALGLTTAEVAVIPYDKLDIQVAAFVDAAMFGRQQRWEFRVHRALRWACVPGRV